MIAVLFNFYSIKLSSFEIEHILVMYTLHYSHSCRHAQTQPLATCRITVAGYCREMLLYSQFYRGGLSFPTTKVKFVVLI